ncbi:MAG: hypothetical protein CM15mP14_0110 [Rhodospirillaceae bacterium]|nr:MAG: hypothetical protein CM15mP14_0110 [Rhodospirillaceae bacterium]
MTNEGCKVYFQSQRWQSWEYLGNLGPHVPNLIRRIMKRQDIIAKNRLQLYRLTQKLLRCAFPFIQKSKRGDKRNQIDPYGWPTVWAWRPVAQKISQKFLTIS